MHQQIQSKERFKTNKINDEKLKRTFGLDGCDVLIQPNIASKNSELPVLVRENAKSYIETGRFKKWKPQPYAQDDNNHNYENTSNATYCYVNNDIENKEQDYFMSGHTCSKSDNNFNNVPFISDVFLDTGRQTTATQTGQQCVFKINHDHVTEESLTNFWSNNVAKSECINKYNHIIDLNQSLSNQYYIVQAKVNQVERDIANQETKMAMYSKQITKSNAYYADLVDTYNGLKITLTHWTQSNSVLEKEFEDYNEMCSSDTTKLSQRLASCDTSCNATLQEYDPLASKLSKLKSEMASYQVRYDGLMNDININTSMLNTVTYKFNTEQAAYNKAEGEYNQCVAHYDTCDRNYGDCKKTLNTDQIYEQLQKDNNDACITELERCKVDLGICTTTETALVKSIQDYRGLTAICVNDKAICIADDARVITHITALDKEYDFVRQYYNFDTCDPYKDEITKLTKTEAELLATCKRIGETNNTTQQNIETINNTNATNLKTSLSSCQNKVEEVRTKMNTPPVPIVETPVVDTPVVITPLQYHHFGRYIQFKNYEGWMSKYIVENISTQSLEAAKTKVMLLTDNILGRWSNGSQLGVFAETNTEAKYQYFPHPSMPRTQNNGLGYHETGSPDGDYIADPRW